jgi:predicted nucleic acid-binding protein
LASGDILVFDTGPLSHFARQEWLGVLKAVVGDRQAIIPDVVVAELQRGATMDSRIQAVIDATWISRRTLDSAEEIREFARFSALLVKGDRNVGEAGALALAACLGGTVVIDDGAGRKAAEDHGVPLKPTLALLCEAIRGGLLTVQLVSALADDLLTDKYRLPFGPGDFARWARDQGQLE